MNRRPTAKRRVLLALRKAGRRGLLTSEISAPAVGGVRASGRTHELQAEGFVISVTRVRAGSWRYTLVSEPDGTLVDPTPQGDAPPVLFTPAPPAPGCAIRGEL
jgi:hypothetical protein